MIYKIARGQNILGEFTKEDVLSGLASGEFLNSDLGWTEGQADWQKLSDLFQLEIPNSVNFAPPISNQVSFPPALPLSHTDAVLKTSALALASLIAGIVSILACGLGGIGSLAAIICGHMALSKISKAPDELKGRGLAIGGLVMGYLSLISALLMYLSVPTFNRIQERGFMLNSINECHQLLDYCKIYAADNNGNFPTQLEQLVETSILDEKQLSELTTNSNGEQSFEYHGTGKSSFDAGSTVIFKGLIPYADGKYIIGRLNGEVEAVAIPVME